MRLAAPVAKEVSMIEQRELKQEEIAHRAYELYLLRGRDPGKDVEDWVRAEKELAAEPLSSHQQKRGPRK